MKRANLKRVSLRGKPLLAALAAWALLCVGAAAQLGVPTTVSNGTIAITNTFQQALAGNGTRKGCTIQNQGTHTMYVFPGTTAAATTAASLLLQSGQIFMCQSTGSSVITDPINITGTAGDAFVVYEQRSS
jgi:hypothetical protein